METLTFATKDLIPRIPVQVRITGGRVFFWRNKIALRALKIGAYVACLIGKNLDIDINC